MIIFSNLESKFQLLDYLPTHDQLLIRSMKNKMREYNIDILIKGVQLLLLPSNLNGLEISLVETITENEKQLIKTYNFIHNRHYKIFSLKSFDNKLYYINAMSFG